MRCGFFIFHMLLLNVPYISIVTIPEPLSSLSTSFTNGSRPSQSHSLNQRNRLPKYSPHPYSTPIFPTTDSGSMESSLDGTFAQLGVERFSDRWYEYWSKECFNLFFCLGFLVRYDSLYWPTQSEIFSSSFDSIKMLTTPLHVKTLSI